LENYIEWKQDGHSKLIYVPTKQIILLIYCENIYAPQSYIMDKQQEIGFKACAPERLMTDILQFPAFIFYDDFGTFAECFCVSLLYNESFFVLLSLFKRVGMGFDKK